MKSCFSGRKLTKQFGTPPPSPFLEEHPLLNTPPLFLSNFFMTPLFVQILKTRKPSNFRGEETMITVLLFTLKPSWSFALWLGHI